MTRRALVTGATGMLGSYIVEQLLTSGWEVRALVRNLHRATALADVGVELRAGTLEDVASLGAAADGCGVVFHAAAAIGAGGDWEAFRRGNVEGTANVVEATAIHGARLVHVSSTAVFGRARYRDEPTDETVPLPDLQDHDVYGRSKQEAERVVLHAHEVGRVWATVVRPPVMYGLRDRQFVPRVAPVFSRGVFPVIAGGGTTLSVVHAGSVAQGAVLAASAEVAGGRVYHLTNDYPVTTRCLVQCAQEGLGRSVFAPNLSAGVGRAGFGALKLALITVGRSDLARHARGTLEMLTRNNPFTSTRARDELGWSPSVPPEIGLTEAFRWWKENQPSSAHGGD